MKLSRMGWLLMGLLALALQACVGPVTSEERTTREPVRWILVERRYGDVARGASGDGTVNPEAPVLAFQPLYPEDVVWDVVVDPAEHFVELISFSPAGTAAPGEVVSATVRVGKARANHRYRLSARPSQIGVKILGSAESIVIGESLVVFRFTSCVSGRAGIAVAAERLPMPDE